jgi:type I restriction enzyme S subunit
VRRGDATKRADVNFNALTGVVEGRLAGARYPLRTIGAVEERLQYGCSKRATVEPIGVPILRMNNLQANGWMLDDLKYVELTDKELASWMLEAGDIVFNRTNSKELVGKCEVFREPGTWVFASYLMRLKVDRHKADPDFVSAFLNGPTGRAQIDRESRQIIGMSNINAEEIRTLRVPLPKPGIQKHLVAELD